MDKRLDGMSYNNVHERIEELKRMFPEAVNEGRLDYDMFMALLGDEFDNEHEKYRFEWKGKLDSLKLAQKRSDGTLRPDFDASREWETTGNLYIEGDNLEVLKLLQQGYLRKIKMIYIDPPYNTGNDFVYEDDFADPIARYKEATGQGMRANPETAGRYHSRWLSMMYPRLRIAKSLLRDDGVIFISIDDTEQANLRKLCDDIFGEESFIGCFVWKRRSSSAMDQSKASTDHEYVLSYHRGQFVSMKGIVKDYAGYSNPDNDPRGMWTTGDLTVGMNGDMRPNQYYDLIDPDTGKVYKANYNRVWSYAPDSMKKLIDEKRVIFPKDISKRPMLKRFANDLKSDTNPISTWMKDVGMNTEGTRVANALFGSVSMFNYAKPLSLIKSFIEQTTSDNDIILDFFSGSGTTAHAVMQLNAEDAQSLGGSGNRKFIMVQIPEPTAPDSEAYKAGYRSIADIGKTRIRRAGDKIMAEWQEKQTGQVALDDDGGQATPPDIGFRVFKLDSSNLKKWDETYVTLDQINMLYDRMEQSLDSLKPDRRAIDVVYEVFLKYGVPLTEKLATLEISGKTFYVVGTDGYLVICLDAGITVEIVEQATQYAPGTIIFSDECFENDDELTNAGLVLEKSNIEFRWI